ncbi:hypothetical protein Avbf_01048 [Armadillidium vulgare]|nr:hypothetical protein Avbf_01048 [Armadillidium vulgare]
MNFTTESLNAFGVETISYLQLRFPLWARLLLNVSLFGDPALAFTFYFPFVVAFGFQVGSCCSGL